MIFHCAKVAIKSYHLATDAMFVWIAMMNQTRVTVITVSLHVDLIKTLKNITKAYKKEMCYVLKEVELQSITFGK